MVKKRFVEESFPITEVGNESATEKNVRHGNIATLHVWWARRPLATSRAINFASLIGFPSGKKEQDHTRSKIITLAQWGFKQKANILDSAKKQIIKENGKTPKVLDPFGGGGSIPLEALRLGCKTYASDYNPVANIILKCTLEYPQKFSTKSSTFQSSDKKNQLIKDLERWGDWVFSESRRDLETFYKPKSSGEEIDGFIWAKTLTCQNPSCLAEIPLIRQYWLANTPKRKIALFPVLSKNKINFNIVGTGYKSIPQGFDPKRGSVLSAIVTCPRCGSTIDGKTTKQLFQKKSTNERLLAIVFRDKKKGRGKFYRIATSEDAKRVLKAAKILKQKIDMFSQEWKIVSVPDESTPDGKGRGAERAFSIRNYGYDTWGDLFNSRQKLALLTYVDKIRQSHTLMLEEYDKEYAKILTTYLALTLDRMAMSFNRFTQWQPNREIMGNMFARQAISMIWDYAEPNASGTTVRSWTSLFSDTLTIVDICSKTCDFPATVEQSSATLLPYADDFFDAVITDPPYYDNVPYSYLSDFFYVWLKRSIGHLYPELFSTPLTPKSNEIVAYSNIPGGWNSGKAKFEKNLKKSFQEIHRVLKPDGISVIVYAHKSTDGWETLINSLLDSGLVITGSWPLHTERTSRMRGQESASLGSSIYMIARKWEKREIGYYADVKNELRNYLKKKLKQLWDEGVSGSDFFVSSIGSAIEVFGKYERVIDDKDDSIPVLKLLNDTREIVTNYAIQMVLQGEFSDQISTKTRFYILWRWAYGESKIPFDDARKMAQSVGMDLVHEWNKGFIRKESESIRVLGPEERAIEGIEDPQEVIDILHLALLLWKNKRKDKLTKLLEEKGLNRSDMFKRVGQAISESLPQESTEKRWLDGFLTGFRMDLSQVGAQTKLF